MEGFIVLILISEYEGKNIQCVTIEDVVCYNTFENTHYLSKKGPFYF